MANRLDISYSQCKKEMMSCDLRGVLDNALVVIKL